MSREEILSIIQLDVDTRSKAVSALSTEDRLLYVKEFTEYTRTQLEKTHMFYTNKIMATQLGLLR
jgi:hypothetical protein